jgi:hypothetical protein
VPPAGQGVKKVTEKTLSEAVDKIIELIKYNNQVVAEKHMGFKKTVAAIKKGGSAENPEAVAASIGRKKYGKEKFQQAAAAGKKLGENLDVAESNDKPETFGDQFSNFIQDFARKRGLTARSGPPPRREPQRNPDIDRIPELEAKLQELIAEYESLGGNSWQRADYEQNLTPTERKARNVEFNIGQLQDRIYHAKRAAEQEGQQGVAEGRKGVTLDHNKFISILQGYQPKSYAGELVHGEFVETGRAADNAREVKGLIDLIVYDNLENGQDEPMTLEEKQDIKFFLNAVKQASIQPRQQGVAEESEESSQDQMRREMQSIIDRVKDRMRKDDQRFSVPQKPETVEDLKVRIENVRKRIADAKATLARDPGAQYADDPRDYRSGYGKPADTLRNAGTELAALEKRLASMTGQG